MSGHSKWAQIKRQKGVTDVRRGQAFTKIANAITLAVKEGGGVGDPNQNFKLRLVIEKAREANMPKENIERAIERAFGKQAGDLETAVYEGFGPYRVAVIVETATDNKQRTLSEIKNIFDKEGGNLGQSGSVSYLFLQMGEVDIEKDNKSFDDILLLAAESGAEDIDEEEGIFRIYTNMGELAKVRDFFSNKGFKIKTAELIRKPTVKVEVDDQQKERIATFIEKLEALADVQKVYTNIA